MSEEITLDEVLEKLKVVKKTVLDFAFYFKQRNKEDFEHGSCSIYEYECRENLLDNLIEKHDQEQE